MYIFVIHIRFNLTMDPVFSFAIFGNTKQEELQLLYQKMSSSPIMKINIAPLMSSLSLPSSSNIL